MCVNNCIECKGNCAVNLCELYLDCNNVVIIDTKEIATVSGEYTAIIEFLELRQRKTKTINVGESISFQFECNENYCYSMQVISPSMESKKYKFCTKKIKNE